MNNKLILPILSGALLCIAAGAMVKTTVGNNKELQKERGIEGAEEAASAAGYINYMSHIRGDATTGVLNVDDVLTTREALKLAEKQSTPSRALPALSWTERGPNNVGGRVRSVLVDKNNTNKVYAAAAGGGLWVSTNAGNDWAKHPISDSLSSMSGSALAQSKDGDIYYGTGEGIGNSYDLIALGGTNVPGDGIFKSTDGGVTFKKLKGPVANTAGDWAFINKIACDPNDNNKVYAATNNGLKKSVDAGVTWTNVSNVSGMVYNVQAGSNGFVWVGTASNYYLSQDNGATFVAKFGTGGLPNGSVTRTEIAICQSSPSNVVLVTIGTITGGNLKGIYKSTDGGLNWTTLAIGGSQQFEPFGSYTETPNRFQGSWDVALGMNPTNPDIFYVGGMLGLYRYTPSENFKEVANWLGNPSAGLLVHADMHGITFDPSNPETMFVNCDGGVYRTNNSSDVNPIFAEKNKNLNALQAYGHGASAADKVIIGAQDNGTSLMGYEANSPQSSLTVGGGDGTKCLFSDWSDMVFRGVVEGVLQRSAGNGLLQSGYTGFYDKVIDVNSTGQPTEGTIWVMPTILNEKFIAKVLVSTDTSKHPNTYVYKDSVNSAMVVATVTSVWFTQGATAGGASPSWFKLSPPSVNGSIISVHLSKDGKYVYAGTTTGKIYRWKGLSLLDSVYKYDNGVSGNWNNSSLQPAELIGDITGRYITSITTDNVDGEEMIVTLGQYAQTSQVYKATTAKSGSAPLAFTDITSNLPKMPVYSAAILPYDATVSNGITDGKNYLLIGTESGVWQSSNGGTTWSESNLQTSGAWHPRVPVVQISVKTNVYNYSGPVVYTSTHGRGAFTSYSLAKQWATGTIDLTPTKESITVYPNPATSEASIAYTSKSATKGYVQIYTITGKIAKEISVNIAEGENKINVDINNLAAGAYIVNLQMPNAKATSTLIKR